MEGSESPMFLNLRLNYTYPDKKTGIMAVKGEPMTTVVKRDNTRETFNEKKLRTSIEAAAREAKLPMDKVKRLVEEISKNIIQYAQKEKELRSATIRENILDKLDVAAPEVSRAWRDYDRRTKGLT
jgi:transcriptional regulator NrdR family protein